MQNMQSVIKIHPLDNVAVALRDLSAGETIDVESFLLCCQPISLVATNLR